MRQGEPQTSNGCLPEESRRTKEEGKIKNGKKPTREQRKLIEAHGLNPIDWLVVKDTPTEMLLIGRNAPETKVIYKEI